MIFSLRFLTVTVFDSSGIYVRNQNVSDTITYHRFAQNVTEWGLCDTFIQIIRVICAPRGGVGGRGLGMLFFFLINYEFEPHQGQFFFKKKQKLVWGCVAQKRFCGSINVSEKSINVSASKSDADTYFSM